MDARNPSSQETSLCIVLLRVLQRTQKYMCAYTYTPVHIHMYITIYIYEGRGEIIGNWLIQLWLCSWQARAPGTASGTAVQVWRLRANGVQASERRQAANPEKDLHIPARQAAGSAPLAQSFVHSRDADHPYWEGNVLCLIYQSNVHLVQSCRYRHIRKQVTRFWLCDPVKWCMKLTKRSIISIS